jgi:Flp pilus assembly protein TadD
VPFAGGKARPMNCNTSLMNSWHTFSPNGRWLAFSSKARSPFTQLMLTHIDADGKDSPAILVDNTTAANRAVNIPEFVNMSPDGMEKIDPQATEIYRLLDRAFDLMQSKKIPEAILVLRKALQLDPTDPTTHYHLALLLVTTHQDQESLQEYRKASDLDPENTQYLETLAVSLAQNGDAKGGERELNKAIAIWPASAEYHNKLGLLLESEGDLPDAVAALQEAVELTKGKEGKYIAELAEGYYKEGKPADAERTAHEALDLAVENNDVPLENELIEDLEKFEHGK